MTTLTSKQIGELSGRELGLAVAVALGWERDDLGWSDVMQHWQTSDYDPIPYWPKNHDAAIALCEELGCDIRMRFNAEPDCWWRLRLSDPSWTPTEFVACGTTIAEAALRAWLKWKTAQ